MTSQIYLNALFGTFIFNLRKTIYMFNYTLLHTCVKIPTRCILCCSNKRILSNYMCKSYVYWFCNFISYAHPENRRVKLIFLNLHVQKDEYTHWRIFIKLYIFQTSMYFNCLRDCLHKCLLLFVAIFVS